MSDSKTQRNYDKKPIVINDKGAFYNLFIYLFIFSIIAIIGGLDAWIREGIYQSKGQVILGVIVGLFSWYMLIKNTIQYFKTGKQNFTFKNNTLSYNSYIDSKIKEVGQIDNVGHLFIVGDIIGRDVYKEKSMFELFFKTDILELFFYLFAIFYMSVLSLIFIMPYRIIFQRAFFVLNKNLVINFKDGTFMNITINNKQEYKEVLEYFKSHNVDVLNKIKFIQINFEEF